MNENTGPMTRRVGGMTYEGKYFIVLVPDDWRASDPLPDPHQNDLWFDKRAAFEAALQGPWDRKRFNRQPWSADPPIAPTPKPQPKRRSPLP